MKIANANTVRHSHVFGQSRSEHRNRPSDHGKEHADMFGIVNNDLEDFIQAWLSLRTAELGYGYGGYWLRWMLRLYKR